MDNPCFNCQDRHIGCHIDCAKRKVWLKYHKDRKQKIMAAKSAEMMLYNYTYDEMHKDFRKPSKMSKLDKKYPKKKP